MNHFFKKVPKEKKGLDFNNRTTYVILGILIFISGFSWFTSFDKIFTGGDWGYFYSEQLDIFLNFNLYNPGLNFGSSFSSYWNAILFVIFSFLNQLGINYILSTKFIIFIPLSFLIVVPIYLVSKKISKSNLGSIISSVLFLGNTYIISSIYIGHIYLVLSFGLMVLSLYFYMCLLEKYKYTDSISFGLFLSLTGVADIRGLYIAFLIIGLYSIYILITQNHNIQYKKIIYKLLIVALVFISISFYWVFLFLNSQSSNSVEVLNRPLFGSNFWNILSAFTLHHPFWSYQGITWFKSNSVSLIYFLIPLLVFISSAVNIKIKNVLFFTIISLIGIFLSKQIDEPLPFVYSFLYANFPGFNAFREPTKFYILTIIGYAVLLSIFTKFIQNIKINKVYKKIILFIYSSIVILTFFSNIFAVYFGQLGGLYKDNYIHNNYKKLNEVINQDDSIYNLLYVPVSTHWSLYTAKNSVVRSTHILEDSWKNVIDANVTYNISPENKFLEIFSNNFSDDFLDRLGIKYVVIPFEIDGQDTIFNQYKIDRQNLVKYLSELNFLEKANLKTEKLTVFENKNYEPPFSVSDRLYYMDNLKNFNQKIDIVKRVDNNIEAGDINITQEAGVKNKSNRLVNSFFNEVNSSTFKGTVVGKDENMIFVNSNYKEIKYKYQNNKLTILEELSLEGVESEIISKKNIKSNIIFEKEMENYDFFVNVSGKPIEIKKTQEYITLGRVGQFLDRQIEIYKVEKKDFIFNNTFSENFQEERSSACGTILDGEDWYANSKEVKDEEGSYYIELSAKNSNSCISNSLDISADKYILDFEYLSNFDSTAGYYIESANNTNQTSEVLVNNRLPLSKKNWSNKKIFFNINHDDLNLAQIRIFLYSFGTEKPYQDITTSYRNITLNRLSKIETVEMSEADNYFPLDINNINKGSINTISSNIDEGANLVSNGSFQDGLFSQEVGNCNAYDSNPDISMSLVEGYKDDAALKLTARRHAACTGKKVFLDNSKKSIILSFNYNLIAGSQVSFYVGFNDDQNTSILRNITPNKKGVWEEYYEVFDIPDGADSFLFLFYAFETDRVTETVNLFDDIKVVEIDNYNNNLFTFQTDLSNNLIKPNNLIIQKYEPGDYEIKIEGVRGSFLLRHNFNYDANFEKILLENTDIDISSFLTQISLVDGSTSWLLDYNKLREVYAGNDITIRFKHILSDNFKITSSISFLALITTIIFLYIASKYEKNTVCKNQGR